MLRMVGKSTLKIDAEKKLRGKALYAADMRFPDMIWLRVLRSHVPRARLKGIDGSEALGISGVIGIFTAKDIPGSNRAGPRVKDDLLSYAANPDRVFDIVVSTYALHHLTDEEKGVLFDTLWSRIRPGGKAIFGDLMFAER